MKNNIQQGMQNDSEETAGWKKELLTINMAVSRRGIGRPEMSCHSHQSGQATSLLETSEGDRIVT